MRRFNKEVCLGIFILFFFSIFFVTDTCLAGGLDKPSAKQKSAPAAESAAKESKSKVSSFFSLSQAYDNNVYLDSRRKEDAFTQAYFKTMLTTPLTEKISSMLEYNLMGMIYAEESNLNLIGTGIRAGLDYKFNNTWNFISDYRCSMTDYLNNAPDDAWEHMVSFQAKQKLPLKMFHSLGYEFMFKDYRSRKTRTPAGVTINNDKTREDKRSTVNYEIGKYFPKDQVKIKFQYYNNNSNERFLHYYDYDSYTGTFALTHLFSKKLFGYCAYSREITDYEHRTITTDNGRRQEDKTYSLTSALYYNIKKDLTVGLSFTYRNNWSNEPVERYQDSIVSLGTFYKF